MSNALRLPLDGSTMALVSIMAGAVLVGIGASYVIRPAPDSREAPVVMVPATAPSAECRSALAGMWMVVGRIEAAAAIGANTDADTARLSGYTEKLRRLDCMVAVPSGRTRIAPGVEVAF